MESMSKVADRLQSQDADDVAKAVSELGENDLMRLHHILFCRYEGCKAAQAAVEREEDKLMLSMLAIQKKLSLGDAHED